MIRPPRDRAAPLRAKRHELRNKSLFLIAGFLFAATILVYAPACLFGFVIVDDPVYVSENPQVLNGLTSQGVKWSFAGIHDANWIPLTWLSLMLDTDVYAGRPAGYHITNLALHAANAVVLFLMLAGITEARWKSLLVAALFALHPLHVESVVWIAERKDVLSTFFGLISLSLYADYARKRSAWRLWVSFSCFVASLLAKQTLVTLPFVFLLLDYWPLGRLNLATNAPAGAASNSSRERRIEPQEGIRAIWSTPRAGAALCLVREKLGFFAASACFCAVATYAQSRGGAISSLGLVSFTNRCSNALVAYSAYLGKTLFPKDLAVYYPHLREGLDRSEIVLAAALILAITGAAVALVRRYPYLFVGWFWYLGTLVPMIGLVQIGSHQMADRYTYFPLIGVFLAATWLIPEIVPAGFLRARILPAAAIASLIMLAVTTYSQISYWHDSLTLLHHSLESTADNPTVRKFLAHAYFEQGLARDAAEELEKAIPLAPDHVPLYIDLGDALQQLGRLDDATKQYRIALTLDPRCAEAQMNLGIVAFKRGEYEEAKRCYRKALELDPDYLPAYANLAALCYTVRNYAAAIDYSEQVLRLSPNSPDSEMVIAMSLRQQGHLDDAIAGLRRVLELKPNDPVAANELRSTLAMKSGTGASQTRP